MVSLGSTGYVLHPTLAADSFPVCRLALCEVRLIDDARFPWLILVPTVPGAREVHDLGPEDRNRLIEESSLCARALETAAGADKINLGALGNLVPQLHWHVVARRKIDACWPGPVWGCGDRVRYEAGGESQMIRRILEAGLARPIGAPPR